MPVSGMAYLASILPGGTAIHEISIYQVCTAVKDLVFQPTLGRV